MTKNTSFKESIAFYSVKLFGALVRRMPIRLALAVGRWSGRLIYYFDARHRRIVYRNLKMAFAGSRGLGAIRTIARQVFQNYGQNFIELLRLPNFKEGEFRRHIRIEGQEHVHAAMKRNKGLILLAMHFGSWELANLASTMMGYPYKVIVKPQQRYSRLDELLNEYRECGGSVPIQKGIGTRDLVRSLKNNEIVAMVMDQGGKEGVAVPFFGRKASMADGAIRLALKMDIPVCFAVMMREQGPDHRVIIHPPLVIERTDDIQHDIRTNLARMTAVMEQYIRERPAEYMWFYKIWKYSSDAAIAVLDEGRTGHLRQAQAVAALLQEQLEQSGRRAETHILQVRFRNKAALIFFKAVMFLTQGRGPSGLWMYFLQGLLPAGSFRSLMSVKSDYVISCGSSAAGVNLLLAQDHQAKRLVILSPSCLSLDRFDLAILPEHDRPARYKGRTPIGVTEGALNLINADYLQEQTQALLQRFSHLKGRAGMKIGILIGGNTKEFVLSPGKIKIVIHQLTEAAEALNADILVTTSRRTPVDVEQMLFREWRRYARCPLLILANRQNVAEAVGGILGMSDIVLVSGDSISMISEAASSGKKTVVFKPFDPLGGPQKRKHDRFIETLNARGYVRSTRLNDLKGTVYDLAKNKIHTRRLDDRGRIRPLLKQIL